MPLAIGAALGSKLVSPRLLLAGVLASCIADADVIAFSFGIPYASEFGHRGFTHSLGFALCLGAGAAGAADYLRSGRRAAFGFVSLSAVSHPLLDAITNGGLGVAIAWPLSDARWFAPWQPLEVSPIGLRGFLSGRGIEVVLSEIVWVWLPLLVIAVSVRSLRRYRSERPQP